MQKVEQYRRRAEECLEMARAAAPELQTHYQALAEMWERLAEERLAFFAPRTSDAG
jgi:hypothetical protein